VDERPVKP